MKLFDGYKRRDGNDTKVLLDGGGSSEFVTELTWDSTNKKLKIKKNNAAEASDFITFGSNAFNSTSYLPLSGGTITGNIGMGSDSTKFLISSGSSGANSPLRGIKMPATSSNWIGLFARPGKSTDEGGILLSEDTCVVYNSHDTGWGFLVVDTDLSQSDWSVTSALAFGVNSSHQAWSLGGFVKADSDNTYMLLGGGGHKLLTDLLTATSLGTNGNNTTISVTVGGTTKTSSVTVPYATNADTVDGCHANYFWNYKTPSKSSGDWDVNEVRGDTIAAWAYGFADSTSVIHGPVGDKVSDARAYYTLGGVYCPLQLSWYYTNSASLYARTYYNGTWYSWKKIAFTEELTWSNISSKPAATGGATTPVYWNGSGFTNCTAYSSASVNYANSAGNADTVDSLHASNLVRFFLSPMTSGAPADSAKSWFTGTMPSASGAIIYNVPGSEKTIIAGKSSGAYGHMLQLNYDDTYLRILRYAGGSWKSTDWEKISAGYADSAGSVAWGNVTNKPFNWSGQSGQPTWLWGSNDGSNYYVWNPSNFSVNYASRAACLDGHGTNPDNSHPGYGAKVFYSWNTGQAGNSSAGYSNGITIGSHPSDQAYGFQIVQNMWDDRTYTRRYNGGWQEWKTLAWTSDLSSYLPKSGGTMSGALSLAANRYSKESDYALNLNNSDIVGVNSICTADLSDEWGEGFLFKRSNGNWDSFRAADGTFYFASNSGTEKDGAAICSASTNLYAIYSNRLHGGNGNNLWLLSANNIYITPSSTSTDGNNCFVFSSSCLLIRGATTGTMTYNTSAPRIVFSENGTLAVGICYTDWDAYRPSKGIKIMDTNNDDIGNVWLEALGSMYAANFYTTSDRNKKRNITILSEHIRKFTLKENNKDMYGVIAQEVPEMFREGEEGNMTVNYNSVLSYYIGILENKVESLQNEVDLLKQQLNK